MCQSRRREDLLPLREAIAEAPGAMLLALLFTSGYGVANYLTMVFLPTYAAVVRRRRRERALAGQHGRTGFGPVRRAARRMADRSGVTRVGHC